MRSLKIACAVVGVALSFFFFSGSLANAECPIESVGYLGSIDTPGIARGIAVSGSYACVTSDRSGSDGTGILIVVDISNPSAPQTVGSADTPGIPHDVVISGNYAYVADGAQGLQIFDVSAAPFVEPVGSVMTPMYAVGVAVSGDYAYVADTAGLQVVDVSNPASPSIIASWGVPEYHANAVVVSGSYAYVTAGWESALNILDISNASSPNLVSSITTCGYAWGITISGSHAYVATSEGLDIVDVSDPGSPVITGFVSEPNGGGISRVTVNGSYAYATNGGLLIIDISDPMSPYIINRVTIDGYSLEVKIAGSDALVTHYDCETECAGALQILDVSHPRPLPIVNSLDFPYEPSSIAAAGSLAYVATNESLEIIDNSDPASPSIVSSVVLPCYGRDVSISGSYAYVAVGEYSPSLVGELVIVDVTNPTAPEIVGEVDTSRIALGVAVSGAIAYVTNETGLLIIDVSDPALPSIVGSVSTPYVSAGVAVSGSYAYVADWVGLEIIDVSDVSSPQIVGSLTLQDPYPLASDVAVSGNYTYMLNEMHGLEIADVSDPTAPYVVSSIDVPYAADMAVSGSYAYVGSPYWTQGVVIVDISNPLAPNVVTKINPRYLLGDSVAVSGEFVYSADANMIQSKLYVATVCPNSGGTPEIALSTTSLSVSCQQGSNATSQTFEVWNSGGGTLSYFVSDNADWLSCQPYSTGSMGEHDTVYVSYATSHLLPGTYSGRIIIADPNATNNPQYIDVTLTVIPTSHTLTATASPPEAGTVSGGGTYEHGQMATIEAIPNAGWKFDHWEGGGITGSTANPEHVAMDADKSVTAVFVVSVLTQIHLVSPVNQSVWTSPPIFVWTADGGRSNTYVVQWALSPAGPFRWSTDKTLHITITNTSWTMTRSAWRKIPTGKVLYWRVKGRDSSQAAVFSSEVWSFKKK